MAKDYYSSGRRSGLFYPTLKPARLRRYNIEKGERTSFPQLKWEYTCKFLMKKKKKPNIGRLIDLALSSSGEQAVSFINEILEVMPENTEALLLLADNTEDISEREKILLRALKSLEEDRNYYIDDKDYLVYAAKFRLSYTYFMAGKFADALTICEDALKVADDPYEERKMKSLYYRTLIELKEWQKVLALTMRDETHDLSWGYSRLIAAWMTAPGKNQNVCAHMFWDALILAPDVPFYMLGYYAEPEEDDDEYDDFDFAMMYCDAIGISEELQQWITRGTIIFGLLTNRFDEREREYLLDVLDTLGGYEEYERMSGILLEVDDESVIEALAANKCLSN